MQVQMPKFLVIFAPQFTEQITVSAPTPNQQVIPAPSANTSPELQIPSSYVGYIWRRNLQFWGSVSLRGWDYLLTGLDALKQISPKTGKRTRKSTKYFEVEQDDSFGESTNSCPLNWRQPGQKSTTGDIESMQPSIVQSIVHTEAQFEPIYFASH